jgi:hypothetical protein
VLTNINGDDGDLSFDRGDCITDRADILSELDVSVKHLGFRVSGAGWYDTVYSGSNSNNSPNTFNAFSVDNHHFTVATRDLEARRFELLDGFFFMKRSFGERELSFRVGRHTLLWGEALFNGTNGIMSNMAPEDVSKLLSVPGTQAKELFMPVGQVSMQLKVATKLSFDAFYQFEYRKNRIPAVGSYFSDADLFDTGGERILTGPTVNGIGPAFFRGPDLNPNHPPAWGVATHFTPPVLRWDMGVYFYESPWRSWEVYAYPGRNAGSSPGKIGEYGLAIPEGIKLVGMSAGTRVKAFNVGGEFNFRWNMPLAIPGAIVVPPGTQANNSNNPLYPVGKTAHVNLSTIYLLSKTKFWGGGDWLAEIFADDLVEVTKNPQNLDPTRSHQAYGLRTILEPTYYQVFPGVDMVIPIVFGYNPKGRSAVDTKFNGGADKGGDITPGVLFKYLQVWQAQIGYTHYIGRGVQAFASKHTQTVTDRDWVSISFKRTF